MIDVKNEIVASIYPPPLSQLPMWGGLERASLDLSGQQAACFHAIRPPRSTASITRSALLLLPTATPRAPSTNPYSRSRLFPICSSSSHCHCALHLEVDLHRRAHGALDVEHLDVLPRLLEQRHEEVDRQLDVGLELVRRHRHVAHGDVHADDLLQLELDRRADLVELGKGLAGKLVADGNLAGGVTVVVDGAFLLLCDAVD